MGGHLKLFLGQIFSQLQYFHRNKKYSLRKVEPPELGPLKIVTIDGESHSNRLLASLIDRRLRMEYSDSEDDDDDDDKKSQF